MIKKNIEIWGYIILLMIVMFIGVFVFSSDSSTISNDENVQEESSSLDSGIICGYNAYNCGDFSRCSEVMEVFNACSYDIHYLDGDEDGIPCESLCS
tara:strand:- start:3498 stop:3788 length:291 start_codon:yes stop_codon:yes gene_type:complete